MEPTRGFSVDEFANSITRSVCCKLEIRVCQEECNEIGSKYSDPFDLQVIKLFN